MATVDPQEFARQILWQLSGIRSELTHTRIMLARMQSAETEIPEDEILNKWKSDCLAIQNKVYLEATAAAGIPPLKKIQKSGQEDRI